MVNHQSEHLINTQFKNNQFKKVSDTNYKFNWFDWFCIWYPPGWLILFNRHWQHYHADPDGWNWLEYSLFLIPGGFYIALLIRWLRLGCRLPSRESGEFDPNYQQAFKEEVIAPIVKYYFRAQLQEIENLPQKSSMIVAMNHAGMCFPWDFLVLGYLLSETKGWIVQPIAGVALFDHPWVIWWLPPGWSKVLGGVRAELKEFEAAIANQKIILYAPEGLRGPGKGWQKRYQLETFESSFIRLSDRAAIPILPVVCIGNESLHPGAFNLKKLAKRFQLPFLPLSILIPIFILFPSMGVWAMRSSLNYYIQPLYQPETTNLIENQRVKRSSAYQRAQMLREKLQNKINQLL